MLDDFKFHIERVDNVLLRFLPSLFFVYDVFCSLLIIILIRMSERANDFLHDTVSLTNIVDLLKSEKIKRDFETIVIADAPYFSSFAELLRILQYLQDHVALTTSVIV